MCCCGFQRLPQHTILPGSFRSRIPEGKSDGRSQPLQFADHPAPVPGRLPGDAARHGASAGRSRQAAGWDCEHVVRGQHLQYAPRPTGGQGPRGGVGRRHGGDAVQHHRGQRRHLDGHRRDELLASLPRHHRRLHRDGDAGPVVRRAGGDPRLRQEHARLPDCDGTTQSAGADGLRRHDQARASQRRHHARHRLGLPVLRRVCRRADR